MNDVVRVGIVGCGGVAGAHLREYLKLPGVRVVALADVVPGRAAELCDRFDLDGAEPFEDYRRLLEVDLDAISVCTPNVQHRPVTIDALSAGRHVLVEKPIAVGLGDAVAMVEAARREKRILSVGFQSRYDQNLLLAKRVLDSGTLGRLYYVEMGGGRRRGLPGKETFFDKDLSGGGAILDIGCYSMDVAMHLLGNPRPRTVSASTANPFVRARLEGSGRQAEVEDFGVALVRFEQGLSMIFKISWAMHAASLGACLFLGTEGGLEMRVSGGLGDDTVEGLRLFRDEVGVPAEIELPVRRPGASGAFGRKIAEFVNAVRDGGPAPIPGEESLRAVAVLEGMYRSAETGTEISIDDLGPAGALDL